MKIATFNVNSIRPRMPIVLDWLNSASPDVLCLQETKVRDEDFPWIALTDAGYKCAYRGEKAYNGVAILSRSDLSQVEFGFDDGGPEDQARLIKASVHGIYIVNTYVPQGYLPTSDKFTYKLEWFKRLRSYFDGRFKPADPVIWLGDLNIAPDDIDVYDPVALRGSVCFHPQVQTALNDVMSWGFTDLFRHYCKDPGQYTFWDYRYPKWIKKNIGWRLDHIMVTKPLVKKSIACYIDTAPRKQPLPSDHTPLVAEFDLS